MDWNSTIGFSAESANIIVKLNKQSADIALGVDKSAEHRDRGETLDLYGAGDQGMMFGYACNETKELMPLPISLAHKLTLRLTEVRKTGLLDYLRPDGKAQVSVNYDKNSNVVSLDAVVLSTQHDETVSDNQEQLKRRLG